MLPAPLRAARSTAHLRGARRCPWRRRLALEQRPVRAVRGPLVRWRGSVAALRRVVIDLHTPEGQSQAQALMRSADVVIENFRPSVAERLGIGYEALAAQYPRVIYCSLPGFGPGHPLRQAPAWEPIISASTGLYPPILVLVVGHLPPMGTRRGLHRCYGSLSGMDTREAILSELLNQLPLGRLPITRHPSCQSGCPAAVASAGPSLAR